MLGKNFLRRIVLLCLMIFGVISISLAQNGTIRGTITDGETGEPLIGATALIVGTTIGGASDLDGNFSISAVAGTYEVQISYVSYETKKVTGVEVKAGEVTIINVVLGTDAGLGLEEVVVEAKAIQNSSAAILTLQKKSTVVLDGISSEQFKRSNDSDVASAIKRVTGVSVEGGKYVYVRGLGDRYSKTSVNGADVPGLDPNRNTVQMDLFPSNLVDNIVVYKTFRPDLPGDFVGGYVDISTKDFPEDFTLQLSSSLGYNSQANLNDEFLTTEKGNVDWLGLNSDIRDIPEVIQNNTISAPGVSSILEEQSSAFQNSFDPTTKSPFLNQSYSFSIGNQVELFGRPLGFIAALSYNKNFESYDNGETNRYKLQGLGERSLIGETLLPNDSKSTESVLVGGLVNLSYKFSDNHKVSFNVFRNQGADKQARVQSGTKPSDNPSLAYFTRGSWYTARSLTMYQLKGEHNIPGWNNTKIDWTSAYSQSTMDQPDLRFFTWGTDRDLGETSVQPSIGQLPTHYYRDMLENTFDNKINFTLPFNQWNDLASKLKFGGVYLRKNREFRENQYRYDGTTNQALVFDGTIDNFFSNPWTVATQNNPVVYIEDAYEAANNYDAGQDVIAAYAMVELPLTDRLKLITGARFEQTKVTFLSFGEIDIRDAEGNTSFFLPANTETTILDNNDILPSANLIYELNDKMNMRVAYNRTLARPTFRELAPFASFDFIGDFILVGNPLLERTLIDNIDLRWEYFVKSGEIFSLSAFYKNFTNPIERVINAELGVNNVTEITFRNLPSATVYGLEIEARKKLDVFTERLKNFTLGANITLIKSVVSIPDDQLDFIRKTNSEKQEVDTRVMYGQSPFVINTFLNYRNSKGTQANLAFNMNGRRLSIVDLTGVDIFEEPRPSLNLNVTQKFGQFSVKVAANNLLNPEYKYTQEYNGREYIFQNSQLGRTYSVGVNYSFE